MSGKSCDWKFSEVKPQGSSKFYVNMQTVYTLIVYTPIIHFFDPIVISQ